MLQKNYKLVLKTPNACPFSRAITQPYSQIGVAPVAPTVIAAPAPPVPPSSVALPISQLLTSIAPTTGPDAVIPQPAPLTAILPAPAISGSKVE